MTYHELLGLDREPFGNSPDPDFFHGSPRHAECLRRLEIAVRLRRGLCVVVGEVGTGKSTVCRRLIRTLGYDPDVLVHLLLDPSFADPRDFLAAVAVSFGILVDGEDSASRIREAIQDYLLRKGEDEGKIVVLCVDEGQKISPECLEILRELLNFETNTHKLLQIVVFAQPEFSAMLEAKKNLADRVNTRYDLRPLPLAETRRLIRARLRLAAGEAFQGREPDIFTDAALRAVHRATRGYPRRIMRLCHAALLETVGRDKARVGVSEVRAARDTGDREPGFSWRAGLVAAVPVVAVLFMVLGPGRERAAGLLDAGLSSLARTMSELPGNLPGYDHLRRHLASGEFFPWRQAEAALPEGADAAMTVATSPESIAPAADAVESAASPLPAARPELAASPSFEPIPAEAASGLSATPPAEPGTADVGIPRSPAVAVLAEAPAFAPAPVAGEGPTGLVPLGLDAETVVIQVEGHEAEPATETAAAPDTPPAPEAIQIAPPVVPVAAAAPPESLGRAALRPGWSLSKTAERLYGNGGRRVMRDIAAANSDIVNLDRVRPGVGVVFPARVAAAPPQGAYVVRMERTWELDEAFSALSRVRERVPGAVLLAWFSPDAGLAFDVVLDRYFQDAAAASQALAGLPRKITSRAGTVVLDDPRAIYYSFLEPAVADSPGHAPVRAVAQNAAIGEAGVMAR